eukprot:Protomagalhaensia_wolfi_Nauph_80__278@NODE_1157_length_1694_cov_131_677341_g884_i0_p2_GENE_NODE_1157_length_1694_cov_131_677341_g884_i0NODE_1157_length_1694_cov_131_677341_g884_i0_p2_ORF_typecomplete_len144_score12_96_NODE_1157_length_1694_cov_131_677341_g884_i010481479
MPFCCHPFTKPRRHLFSRQNNRRHPEAAAFYAIVSNRRHENNTGQPLNSQSSFQPEGGAVGLTLPIPVRRTIEIGPRGPKISLLSGWLPPKNVSPASKDDPLCAFSHCNRLFSPKRAHSSPRQTPNLRLSPLAQQRAKAPCYA